MAGFFQSRVRARDVEQAEAGLRERYGPVAIAGDRIRYAEHTFGDDRFALGSIELDGGFSYAATFRAVTICASTPGAAWQSGEERGELSRAPALFQPGEPLTGYVERTRATAVALDPAALTRFARVVYADDRLEVTFRGADPVTVGAGRAWVALVEGVAALDARLEQKLLRTSAYRTLALAALELFRLDAEPRRRPLTIAAATRAYRKATGFLDDYASLPITVEDAAAHAGVPAAQLRRTFADREPTGLSPTAYLARTRLVAAHHDLADPDDETSVGDVALRWGFADTAAFARLHRAEYGTDPRDAPA
ncbi:MAG: helix-turn-helix domain-containing protein [Amnibacterium sp.]